MSAGGTTAPPWANASAQQSGNARPVQEEIDDPNSFLTKPYSTLDEPVRETIMRDVRSVAGKLRVVLLPLDRNTHFGYSGVSATDASDDIVTPGENQKQVIDKLKEWDLWGPLLVCLALSVILSFRAPVHQASAVFGAVFVAVWVGSAVVTVNAQLLGSTLSFFQSVCVLGYCVFPLTLAALLISLLQLTWFGVVWVDLIWVTVAFVWACRASAVFIGQVIPRERRFLAIYPVFFFYTFLGWLILLF
mmetsp:Transcript_23254/g.50408  ORF Transcript_23254/g.50408 Transcript_23254/m.50408 type:complete len:247 (+) Transcript_23254:168-908(+)